MKKIISLFFSFFIFHFSFSQSWLRSENGIGLGWVKSLVSDGQGNCYFSGFFDDYDTLNFSGNLLMNPQKNQDGGSMFIIKMDKNGHIIWNRQSFNYDNYLFGNGYVVALDGGGNVYEGVNFSNMVILGTYNFLFSTSLISEHYYLVKYNTTGKLLWAAQPIVQIDSDQVAANYVSTDKNGNAFVTGLFNADTVFLGSQIITGTRKVVFPFLVKYDSNGNVLWAKGTTGNTIYGATSTCVVNDKNGNSYITGRFADSITFGSITLGSVASYTEGTCFLTKYDPNGNAIWARVGFIKGHQSGSQGYGLATDLSGNIYVAGDFVDTVTFGSYKVIGSSLGNIFLAKYDSNGNVLWAKQSKGLDGNNWGVGTISIDNYKHIYLSGGGGAGNCEVAFGDDTLRLNDTASQDHASIILKFDSNGNVLCGSIISGGAQYGNAVTSDTSGKFVYFGSTTSTPLIFGADTINPFAYPKFVPLWNANYFPFVARWEACDSAIFANVPGNKNPVEQVSLYPNPNKGTFTLALNNANEPAQLEIYNILGEEIYNAKIKSDKTEINLGTQLQGVYFYRVLTESCDLVGSGKIIIY